MCRSRLWLLYWVSTHILRMPPLARLESAKSISRYRPPNGTAGLARSAVSGLRRVPAPPASTIPRTDGCAMSGPPKTLAAGFVRRLSAMLPRIGRNREELTGGDRRIFRIGRNRIGRRRGSLPDLLGQHLQGPGRGDSQQRGDEGAEQAADEAAEGRADQDRDKDEQRADLHRLAHDHRVQDVVLDLGVDEEDHRGDDARGEAVGQRE